MRDGASENLGAGRLDPEPAVERPTPDNRRASSTWRRRRALGAAALLCLLPSVAGQAAQPSEQPEANGPEAVLFDAGAEAEARTLAARALAEQQRFDWLAASIEAASDPIASRLVLDALLS
ncbi:MAG: hypothetical protein ACF8QF_00235, partial [Phycisphaerales bacterium]